MRFGALLGHGLPQGGRLTAVAEAERLGGFPLFFSFALSFLSGLLRQRDSRLLG